MSSDFETVCEMELCHLPNKSKLVIQRQTGEKIPKDSHQFGLPSTFVNPDNSQIVWNRGPSIQLEQFPELIKILTQVYEKYSKKKIDDIKPRTYTFADMVEQ